MPRTTVLPYDQRPWTFDLDKVETSYLVLLDTPAPTDSSDSQARLLRLRDVSRKLQDDHGFPRWESYQYAQAAEIYAGQLGLPTTS